MYFVGYKVKSTISNTDTYTKNKLINKFKKGYVKRILLIANLQRNKT